MDMRNSKLQRRIGVVVNFASLALFLVIYYSGIHLGWRPLLLATGAIVTLAIAAASFLTVHVSTGLWKLGHSHIDKLDERQIQVTHEALRHAYATFTVIALAIIGFNAVAGSHGHYVFDVVLPVILIYVAHVLPASIIAWREKVV
jgi:hypothetical protein